ncbi:hypothetical protein BV20DRAFT_926676, partial [Pilatotrama ljubarskyi]
PGEEAVLASHAGGEEDLCRELFALKTPRHDGRSRRDRTQNRNAEWASQLPAVTDAYLSWKASIYSVRRVYSSSNCTDTLAESVVTSFTPSSSTEMPNVTLAKSGCLGVAPLYPTIAISFRVLEVYRQFHGVCPRFSIHAFCQGLCRLHGVPYQAVFAEQFSATFDVYLDILHHVDTRVATALSRDSKDWRMRNTCIPCLYRLQDEAPLKYDLLAAMDGNSSLKLVDETYRSGIARQDGRVGRTDLFIPVQEVDRFKDEVENAR